MKIATISLHARTSAAGNPGSAVRAATGAPVSATGLGGLRAGDAIGFAICRRGQRDPAERAWE